MTENRLELRGEMLDQMYKVNSNLGPFYDWNDRQFAGIFICMCRLHFDTRHNHRHLLIVAGKWMNED